MTDTAWQPTLDGLTLPGQGRASGMEAAAMRTIRRLDQAGVLDEADTLTVQLVLELAAVIGRGVTSGRASAVAMAAKELREALATLPDVNRGPEGDSFDALSRALAESIERGEPARPVP